MTRVYQRKFDWDEAARLHREGLSYYQIGKQLGVSYGAVRRVLDPEWGAELDRRARAWMESGICEDCGTSCTRFSRSGKIRCLACAKRAARTRFKYDELGALVEIRCGSCQKWLPVSEFPHDRYRSEGIRGTCRSCDTAKRSDYRRRNLEAARRYDREYKRRKRAAVA